MEKLGFDGNGEAAAGRNTSEQLQKSDLEQQQELQQNNDSSNGLLLQQQQQIQVLPQFQQHSFDVQQQQYQQMDEVGAKRGFQEEGILQGGSQQGMLSLNQYKPMFGDTPYKKTKVPPYTDLCMGGGGLGVVAPDQSLFVAPRSSLQLPQIPQLLEQRKPLPCISSLPPFYPPGQSAMLQPQLLQRTTAGLGITPQLINKFQMDQLVQGKHIAVSAVNHKLPLAQEILVEGGETSDLGGCTVVVESIVEGDNGGERRSICQVQDCSRSLKGLKDFHLRYRICDVHIKLPQVMKEGKLQRFCQQCARFHELGAFDGHRRSCRVQLERHNARRRKKKVTDSSEDKPLVASPLQPDKQFTLTTHHLPKHNSGQQDMDKIIRAFMEKPEYLVALRQLMWPKLHFANQNNRSQEIRFPNGQEAADGVSSSKTCTHALELLNHSNLVSYSSRNRSMRVCQKLFEVRPEDLPGDISDVLLGWLAEAPIAVDTAIRPGCTFVTTQFIVKTEVAQKLISNGVQPIIHHLLNTALPHSKFFHCGRWSIQLEEHMGIVRDGIIEKLWNLADPKSGGPSLQQVEPMVLTQNSNKITVQGCNILDQDSKLICRHSKGYFEMPIAEISDNSLDWIQSFEFEINDLDKLGKCVLLLVEVQKGALLSNFSPIILIQNNYAISEELKHLLQSIQNSIQHSENDAILIEIGQLIELYFDSLSGNDENSSISSINLPKLENSSILHQKLFKKIKKLKLNGILEFVCAQVCQLGLPNLIDLFLSMRLNLNSLDDFLLMNEKIVRSEFSGLSLMHLAVCSEETEAVRQLLQFCRKYNIQTQIGRGDEQGVTPLHLATLVADADVMTILLLINFKLGCLSQTMGFDGISPLHLAYLEGSCMLHSVLKLLKIQLSFFQQDSDLDKLYTCKSCRAKQSQILVSFLVFCGNCLGFKGALMESNKKCKICSSDDGSGQVVCGSMCMRCMRGFEQSIGQTILKHNALFS